MEPKIVDEVDAFIDKARTLKIGESVEFDIPKTIRGLQKVRIKHGKPIGLYYTSEGYSQMREVLWSPSKLRKYILWQMGCSQRTVWWPSISGWRSSRVERWWASEWDQKVFHGYVATPMTKLIERSDLDDLVRELMEDKEFRQLMPRKKSCIIHNWKCIESLHPMRVVNTFSGREYDCDGATLRCTKCGKERIWDGTIWTA